jgi:hypothetical protein
VTRLTDRAVGVGIQLFTALIGVNLTDGPQTVSGPTSKSVTSLLAEATRRRWYTHRKISASVL